MSPGSCSDLEGLMRAGVPEDDARVVAHREHCPRCLREAEDFAEIARLAAGLRRPPDDAGLGRRIEAALRSERRTSRGIPHALGRGWWFVGPLAAAAVVITLLPWFSDERAPDPRGTLVTSDQVAQLESELGRIASELDHVLPAIRETARQREIEAHLLLDRLELLDAHMETCRELQARNAMNAGLHRALITTARQKIELCREFLSR
jgi:hypothetical protein